MTGTAKKGDKNSNFALIYGTVNEGEQIKKTLDQFLKKVMRAIKIWKQIAEAMFFYFLK